MDVLDGSKQCLVCTAPTTSTHLGKDTCGACASFFKRSKMMGQQYSCRKGDLMCTTSKDGKFVCRRCRFDKCLAIGMEYEGLLRARRNPPTSILQRIKIELNASFERRKEQELALISSHRGHLLLPHPTEELYGANQATMFEIYRISVVDFYKFFQIVFPAVTELHSKERHLIFKDYVGKLAMAEGYHRARQLWGGTTRYTMCSVMTCYDLERKIGFEELEKCANAGSLLDYVKTITKEQNDVFLPIYNQCSMDEREYYALVALVMCEIDSDIEISEEAQLILDGYRTEVLDDLRQYYQNEMGLENIATRLGNLMSLNHAIQECKSLLKIFFSFYATLFDVFITDNLIKEFFL